MNDNDKLLLWLWLEYCYFLLKYANGLYHLGADTIAAGVDGGREAHDAAVLSVLSHMEEHYCHYRSPERIRCGDKVVAKFDHATSRNVDPQLHSHVFVVNAVHTQDGSWRANDSWAIFKIRKP